ncbi:Glucan endo-1,3-beta-glucosidase A1 precursor [Mycobacterium sp. THAF192]|nr:Glucan endo-1,3-beta-glucosidase A1 precursor [Mycobacterium sp. THAF192]
MAAWRPHDQASDWPKNVSTPARYVGRVGALAVALGVGMAIATGPAVGTASADEGAESSSQDQGEISTKSSDAETVSDEESSTPDDDESSEEDDPEDATDLDEGAVDIEGDIDSDIENDDEVELAEEDSGEPAGADAIEPDSDGVSTSRLAYADDETQADEQSGTLAVDPVTIDAVSISEDSVAEDEPVSTAADSDEPAVPVSTALVTDDDQETVTVRSPSPAPLQDQPDGPIEVILGTPAAIGRIFDNVISALTSPSPGTEPPGLWALLAFVRREFDRTFNNRTPTAVGDNVTTSEDLGTTFAPLANDTDEDLEAGDILTVTEYTQAANGSVALNADGTFTYTPTAGFAGMDSFSYTISDAASPWHVHGLAGFFSGRGYTSTTTVTITVASVNDAPTAADDTATAGQNTSATGNLLANDTDPDGGDTLTVQNPGPQVGSHGELDLSPDGTFTYTPNARQLAAGQTTTDTFTYTVTDGELTDTATLTVTVTGTNDAPNAVDDVYTVDEDTTLTRTVLSNDTDPDTGTTLSVSGVVNQPVNGSVTIDPGGTFTYTPVEDFYGTDSFTYTVTDGVLTDTATVYITVTSVVDAPEAVDDVFSAPEDTVLTGNILDNDSGEALTAAKVIEQPDSGDVYLNADGSFTYTPDPDFYGIDSFTYELTDGESTDTATAFITITNVNDEPSANGDTGVTTDDTALTGNVLSNDDDPDSGSEVEVKLEDVHKDMQVDLSEGFHDYGIEWRADEIIWTVDGDEVGRVTQQEYEELGGDWTPFSGAWEHYLILTLAVGHPWTGDPDPAEDFTAQMKVDWVRAYDLTGTDHPTEEDLLWGSEFSDMSEAQENWIWQTGRWGQAAGENQYYTDGDNVFVDEDGNLVIEARCEAVPDGLNAPDNYTSGRVVTYEQQTVGVNTRVVARIQLPGNQGVLPAFWTAGLEPGHEFEWPRHGEIDIMEYPQTGDTEDRRNWTGNIHGPAQGDTLAVQDPGSRQGSYGTLELAADGSYTYTPTTGMLAAGQEATDTFTYTVTDGELTDTATLIVTVTGTGPRAL